MFLPITSSIGLALANTSGLPPTIKVRVPAIAPPVPPETGASKKSMPSLVASSATLRASAAAMVLLSMTSVPFGRVESKPFEPLSPKNTACTCRPAGNILITTWALLAASSGLLATLAPACCRRWVAASDKSYTFNV